MTTPTPPVLPGLPKFPAVVTIGLTVFDGALGLALPYLSGPWRAGDLLLAALLVATASSERMTASSERLTIPLTRHKPTLSPGLVGARRSLRTSVPSLTCADGVFSPPLRTKGC